MKFFFTHMGERILGVRSRNRPLRGFATHREMRPRRRRRVGRGRRPSREAVARARANTPSEASAEGSELEFGVGVGEWRVEVGVRERCSKGAPPLHYCRYCHAQEITNREVGYSLVSCKGSYPQKSEIP